MDNNTEKNVTSPGENTPEKHELKVPLIALGLSLSPVLILVFFLGGIIYDSALDFAFILIFVLPVAGVVTGVMALLEYGRERIGAAGRVIAIIAIGLPMAAVLLIIAVMFGAPLGILGEM